MSDLVFGQSERWPAMKALNERWQERFEDLSLAHEAALESQKQLFDVQLQLTRETLQEQHRHQTAIDNIQSEGRLAKMEGDLDLHKEELAACVQELRNIKEQNRQMQLFTKEQSKLLQEPELTAWEEDFKRRSKRNEVNIGVVKEALELLPQLESDVTDWQELAGHLAEVVVTVKKTKVRGFTGDPEAGDEGPMAEDPMVVDEYSVRETLDLQWEWMAKLITRFCPPDPPATLTADLKVLLGRVRQVDLTAQAAPPATLDWTACVPYRRSEEHIAMVEDVHLGQSIVIALKSWSISTVRIPPEWVISAVSTELRVNKDPMIALIVVEGFRRLLTDGRLGEGLNDEHCEFAWRLVSLYQLLKLLVTCWPEYETMLGHLRAAVEEKSSFFGKLITAFGRVEVVVQPEVLRRRPLLDRAVPQSPWNEDSTVVQALKLDFGEDDILLEGSYVLLGDGNGQVVMIMKIPPIAVVLVDVEFFSNELLEYWVKKPFKSVLETMMESFSPVSAWERRWAWYNKFVMLPQTGRALAAQGINPLS
jgi:hypothetical protein